MKKKHIASTEDAFYITGIVLLLILLIYSILSSLTGFRLGDYMMPCIFHLITGLYCPGCGGTRACWYLLHGDVLRSFIYHPFVVYSAVICGWFLISQTIERASRHRIHIGMRYRDIYLWIAVAIVVLNFVVKNVAIVAFHTDMLR